MSDNELPGCSMIVVFALVVVALISINTCSDIRHDTECAENMERHATTAADTLRLVRSGCHITPEAK